MTRASPIANPIIPESIMPESTLFVLARICALYRMDSIILLIAVIPVMIYNLRQFRERKAF